MMQDNWQKNGFFTFPFPQVLRQDMLEHINGYIMSLGNSGASGIESVVKEVPDEVWQKKMSRSFRIFPKKIAQQALEWSHQSFCAQFDNQSSAVNVVLPEETKENPKLREDDLAVYWRCVRPNKPDAGRPHRDAGFWNLELQSGYDPQIPFPFNYLTNCKKIWIPLTGCSANTTLRIVPGSHKMDIPTTIERTEYGDRPTICPLWIKENQHLFVSPPELSQGSCIVFDMNLVHVGPCHHQDTVRISAEFNFIAQ